MPKQQLRDSMLIRRAVLTDGLWQTNSQAAQQRLLALDLFQRAARLALYAPLKHEIDTALLFDSARQAGKQVLYPLVCGDRLTFHEIETLGQLQRGSFGILEPCLLATAAASPDFDLMVVPGVAFDLQGHRIGFGKGYYDRYLAGLTHLPTLVGLCHDFQVCSELPAEGHDIRMHYLVTEARLLEVAVTDRP